MRTQSDERVVVDGIVDGKQTSPHSREPLLHRHLTSSPSISDVGIGMEIRLLYGIPYGDIKLATGGVLISPSDRRRMSMTVLKFQLAVVVVLLT